MSDTIKLFEGLRTKLGCEINLCHDVHERLHLSGAIQFARALEPFQLFFLEDAVPLEHLEWLHNLRASSSIHLSIGELFINPYEWKTIISGRLIDFSRVHISQTGGIIPARKL